MSRRRADRGVRPYIRLDKSRISYVKYSTGANVTTYIVRRAMRKPDSTVARRAFLDRRCYDNTHNVAKCFFARKRYFASPSTLFSTIFSLAREKMVPPEAQLRCRRKNGTSVNTKNVPRLRCGIAPSGRKRGVNLRVTNCPRVLRARQPLRLRHRDSVTPPG